MSSNLRLISVNHLSHNYIIAIMTVRNMWYIGQNCLFVCIHTSIQTYIDKHFPFGADTLMREEAKWTKWIQFKKKKKRTKTLCKILVKKRHRTNGPTACNVLLLSWYIFTFSCCFLYHAEKHTVFCLFYAEKNMRHTWLFTALPPINR